VQFAADDQNKKQESRVPAGGSKHGFVIYILAGLFG